MIDSTNLDEMKRVRSSFSKGVSLRATRTAGAETTSTETSVSHQTPSLISESRVMSLRDYRPEVVPLPPNSCVYWYHIWQFDRFSASPLNSDDFRRYPMHMRLNGASKTLIRLIEAVLPISHLIQCKNTAPRQQLSWECR